MDETKEPISDEQQVLELGIMLGQRRAFGMIAGRCSAAQADCLSRIKEEKVYLKFAPSWAEYCERHLQINVRTADRVIGLLKKHGTLYFETAALTGISPAEYARIEPNVQDDGIHVGAEVVALIPENASRAIDAIAQLQAEANAAGHAKPEPTAEEQIAGLVERGRKLCAGFHQTAKVAKIIERAWLIGAIKKVQAMVNRLELEIR